jgi:hypothetical protein
MKKNNLSTILSSLLIMIILITTSIIPAYTAGPPDIQRKVFIHYAKPDNPGKGKPSNGEDNGFYKLISGGIKWKQFPVSLEVNLEGSGLESIDQNENLIPDAIEIIGLAAEEWDDGAYSGWGGVSPNLFDNTIRTTMKGYEDLAWSSDKLDGANTLIWGNYPTEGVIAVTILWYNVKTKEIIEFDIVFDTDFLWSLSGEDGKMDLQNIATHELGHGVGLDDLHQDKAYQETMYGYSDYGEIIKRDLYIGDIKGITKLYG